MPFPLEDEYWVQTKIFLQEHTHNLDPILAPNEFIEFFPGNYPYSILNLLPIEHFKFVAFHKGMTSEIAASDSLKIVENFHIVFANDVFVVFSQLPIPSIQQPEQSHVIALLEQLERHLDDRIQPRLVSYGAFITTYNRPSYLKKSIPQIIALGIQVIVIDDASTPENSQINRDITHKYDVPLIYIPENRGLPNAMNVGLNYWLADPDIDWIAYFQDDVDVHPNTLKTLAQIQDPHKRPVLTGRNALEHPTFGTDKIVGYDILYKRSTSGIHIHAHRDYWRGVMPIPTPYLGAPKQNKGKPGQGADEDWWITCWSPQSIAKRGGYIVCVPDLVQTFCMSADESTWGNPNQ